MMITIEMWSLNTGWM